MRDARSRSGKTAGAGLRVRPFFCTRSSCAPGGERPPHGPPAPHAGRLATLAPFADAASTGRSARRSITACTSEADSHVTDRAARTRGELSRRGDFRRLWSACCAVGPRGGRSPPAAPVARRCERPPHGPPAPHAGRLATLAPFADAASRGGSARRSITACTSEPDSHVTDRAARTRGERSRRGRRRPCPWHHATESARPL